jgi:hypothetical protein
LGDKGCLGGAYRLGVHQRRGRLGFASFNDADLLAQRVVLPVERAIADPPGVLGVDDLPGREVGR